MQNWEGDNEEDVKTKQSGRYERPTSPAAPIPVYKAQALLTGDPVL